MARTPSLWYWPERNGWYTILDGRRYPLGGHPADLPPPTKRKGKWAAPPAVATAFHALLATRGSGAPARARTAAGATVAEVLDRFLDWVRGNRAPRTYEWYRDHLQNFLDHLGPRPVPAADLRPFHVVGWVDGRAGWGPAYRRGAIVAVQRAFNWAEELGYVPASPVKRVRKPRPRRRESYVTPESFAGLLARYPEGDPFRDLLEFCLYSGCRPQEAAHVEARHLDLAAGRVVIPREEAKGRRAARVILLHGPALEVARRLAAARPGGKLLRNEAGRPWTRFAVANRFDRLALARGAAQLKEFGVAVEPLPRFDRRKFADPGELAAARAAHRQALRDRRRRVLKLAREHATKLAAYDLRPAFCQRLLEGGAGHMAVAELMGHASGRMVAETYSHMNRATAHLREALRRGDGPAGPPATQDG